MARLTLRRLQAIEGALNSMLAGECEESGDWPHPVTRKDMDSALAWAQEQIEKRQPDSAKAVRDV